MAVVMLAGVSLVPAGCGGSGSTATTTSATRQSLSVSLTDAGCSPASLTATTGPLTVEVANRGTWKVSELELKNSDGIILAERENVIPGLSGRFSLDLRPGRYVLNCPNADSEDNGVLVVTGNPTTTGSTPPDPLLSQATGAYSTYVSKEADRLLAGTRVFVAALRAGDLARAKSLFGPVRYHYEAIEPVAESFGNLDPAIDARANDVASPSQWTGFHRIEQILWVKGTTRGTEPYATRLLRDVGTLDRRVQTLTFQPAQLANGAVELLNEVANSKITGEEDRYSHTDLSDFEGNLTGAQIAFQMLRPALVHRGDRALAATIAARFAAVQRGLETYQRNTPLGFAHYGELTPADRLRFSQEVGALAEPLSTVAARVSQ